MAGRIGDIVRRIFRSAPPPRPAERPFFRFHPGAYGRSFEQSDEPCGVCGRTCIWRYTGGIYVAGPEPVVCAWCIADGCLAKALSGGRGYSLFDAHFDDAEEALEEEVMLRTPGFSTFNPFEWPVIDGAPLAFAGYGDEPDIWANPDARTAIDTALTTIFGADDVGKPSPYALVFRQLDGPRYVAVVDLD